MEVGGLNFGVIELILLGFTGILGYMWRTQSTEVRRTAFDLNKLAVRFAEFKGAAEATNKTLFAHIEEMKDAIARIENHIIATGGKKDAD